MTLGQVFVLGPLMFFAFDLIQSKFLGEFKDLEGAKSAVRESVKGSSLMRG